MTASRKGFFNAFKDVWMLDGVRTPMVDYCGSLGHISPTDLGIKAARAVLARAGVPGEHIGTVITGNMELLSACRNTTFHSDNPLARAVRM